MIKENQRLLNQLNVLSDGLMILFAMLLAYATRFLWSDSGIVNYPLPYYLLLALGLVPIYLLLYAMLGLYGSFRSKRTRTELARLFVVNLLCVMLLLSGLYVFKVMHFSRLTIFYFFIFQTLTLSVKRILLRLLLHYYRRQGYNLKHVLVVGAGEMAREYVKAVRRAKELGYHVVGYLAQTNARWPDVKYLGDFSRLAALAAGNSLDEVVIALPAEEYNRMPEIIAGCEKGGTKLSIIPFYAQYIPAHPQFDEVNGIPLMNLRRIPLDNIGNACIKRAMDIVGALMLLIVTSPIMLVTAIGVKLSSPGPVIFAQERVGRNKKPFRMYKFRSMRVNSQENSGWSTDTDDRKTAFGAFIRKFSIDEFPQFWNVLKGDMSLVGPRPEVPYYVEQFKEEVPLYMVKHQVRPGITGWAQINGFRGDTSIKGRIEHDIDYIENWSLPFDLKILFLTVCKGFINSEKLTTGNGRKKGPHKQS